MKELIVKKIPQSQITDECWTVQFEGLSACPTCPYQDSQCGGKKIRETGRNSKGFEIGWQGFDTAITQPLRLVNEDNIWKGAKVDTTKSK